ncbi:YggS family pyridoxal phosphate-dependent enzyme [Bianquea renquensis]|uniref:Pyridoxal phosphate homeostasis protein n=1 Tax=Bianquea renquensis TaxID=2763661 RepID=A0A926DPT8_9FIRM|nr:YggS family pyridoxal phosphate-dependent enzyme [Bianquea renquensis]MBC8542965.1 YggS family pyridoxal phosphate-dependent enzyme [Bianquea renquensis]
MELEELRNNLESVRDSIARAAARAGRNPEDVLLLPVTKTLGADVVEQAWQLGIRQVGENKVQEILSKKEVMGEKMQFHMIGHLQRNKVHQVLDKVCLIHSVDSVRLAEEINREAEKKGLTARILLELNVAREESKYGILEEDLDALLQNLARFQHIRVEGLMTVAPFVENPEENRKIFRRMREIFIDIRQKKVNNIDMQILSMGMTNDYEIAVEEGATIVRVGTGLFGHRQKK